MKVKTVVSHPATGKEWHSAIEEMDAEGVEAEYKTIMDVTTNDYMSLNFVAGNKRYYFPSDFLRECVISVITEPQAE